MKRSGGREPRRIRLERARRRLGFDHNVLRREVDHRQWAVGLVLAVVALGAVPFLALRAADLVYDAGVRMERHERASRHPVTATMVRGDRQRNRLVTVAWTEPDGRRLSGTVVARRPLAAGDRVRVWVDPEGRPSSDPARRRSQTIGNAITAGVGGALAAGLPLILVYAVFRRRCDRVRDRQWDAAWARLDTHHAR